MKIFVPLLLISTASIVTAQTNYLPVIAAFPEWKITVKVIDQDGMPLVGAKVDVGSSTNFVSFNMERLTDTNGLVTVSAHAAGSAGCVTEKSGYYTTVGPGKEFHDEENGKWQPWNPLLEVTLKRIINPVSMYAKSVNLGLPVFDKSAGFDLMAGDWIAPYGKGVNGDIRFNGHLEKRAEFDSDYTLTVSFPNTGDGIQEFSVPATRFPTEGSGLRSSQQAPADGYQPQWIQTRTTRPGRGYGGNRDDRHNYYFRVRTVLDEKGNVKSALYGKIYGDFMQFRYYLNPTPNDRNVEFDPKRNLLQGLKSFEEVRQP